jgi:DNA-binding MarR family transcriptional regulator
VDLLQVSTYLTLAVWHGIRNSVNMVDTSSTVNLGQLLLRAFRWFDEGLVAHLRHAGWPELTRAHSLVFANLDTSGTRTSELARRTGVSRQAIHKIVHELVRMGMVELSEDTTNRSAKLVVPTAEGQRSTKVALATFRDLEAELTQRIGADLLDQLRHALEQDWGPPVVGR